MDDGVYLNEGGAFCLFVCFQSNINTPGPQVPKSRGPGYVTADNGKQRVDNLQLNGHR